MGPLWQAVSSCALRSFGGQTGPCPLTRVVRPYNTAVGPKPVPSVACTEQADLVTVLEHAYRAEQPLVLRQDGGTHSSPASERRGGALLPAADRWFIDLESARGAQLAPYLEQGFAMVQLPYELTYHPPVPPGVVGEGEGRRGLAGFLSWLAAEDVAEDAVQGTVRRSLCALLAHHLSTATAPPSAPTHGGDDISQARLLRFHAPLALLLAALAYNRSPTAVGSTTETGRRTSPMTQLYIAQASLADLPPALQADLPVPPPLARRSPPRSSTTIRGDVYDASLWLGLEPTYTPWHRDPNPNLFGQLCSRKTVRLMPPAAGERLFRAVQTELLRKYGDGRSTIHARIRGEEMMQGPERAALHQAVWGRAEGASESKATASPSGMHETRLGPGDLLFIPKGWWHSVKSAFVDGQLNGSVNWWFR